MLRAGLITAAILTLYSHAHAAPRSRCAAAPKGTAEKIALVAPSDCSMNSTTINPDYDDGRTFVIQVVFHVMKKADGTGDIAPAMLQSQIDILNEDFLALPSTPGAPGTNSRIQFVLAKFDPQGNPTSGINVVTNDNFFSGRRDGEMKAAHAWDPERYLNVYTNDAPGLLGYATFPAESAGSTEDGIVLAWDAVGRNSPAQDYNQGRTATHEIGHYLGLYHTFQGGCTGTTSPYTAGDLIADTTPDRESTYECMAGSSGCTGGGADPIENYMEYTTDVCMNRFTPEQANRMRCSIVNYRTVNTPPTAAFSFTAAARDVTFTNTSTDAETPTTLHYNWSFGDGGTSTEANPVHAYAADGEYMVSLVVVDPGSGSATATQMVVIVPAGPDAGVGGGDGGDGEGESGGCCQAPQSPLTLVLCAVPVAFVLGRRRRR